MNLYADVAVRTLLMLSILLGGCVMGYTLGHVIEWLVERLVRR